MDLICAHCNQLQGCCWKGHFVFSNVLSSQLDPLSCSGVSPHLKIMSIHALLETVRGVLQVYKVAD